MDEKKEETSKVDFEFFLLVALFVAATFKLVATTIAIAAIIISVDLTNIEKAIKGTQTQSSEEDKKEGEG